LTPEQSAGQPVLARCLRREDPSLPHQVQATQPVSKRGLRAEQPLARRGVNPVAADHQVVALDGAIAEGDLDPIVHLA
jgi:hypothetical protein